VSHVLPNVDLASTQQSYTTVTFNLELLRETTGTVSCDYSCHCYWNIRFTHWHSLN